MGSEKLDLLVIGGGLAGLSAAARAVENGASVVVVEKAPAVGGSALYAGFLWTTQTMDVMREINPDGDPALGARLVDGYDAAMTILKHERPERTIPVFKAMERLIEELGKERLRGKTGNCCRHFCIDKSIIFQRID